MKTGTNILFLSVVAFAGAVFGASPVATLSTNGTFELRGTAVRTEGVPSWPVMAGDVIGTSGSAAVIRFADGSRVTLGEKSRAKVEKTEDGLIFRLISGAMNFTVADAAGVAFYDNAKVVTANPGVATSVTAGPSSGIQSVLHPMRSGPVAPPGSFSVK